MNEYNQFNIKIFEGEYINGLKNGKGKEYHKNGKLSFEGEYLNDLKNGMGYEYYLNGKIKSEGEYLFGKYWNIKVYDKNHKIINELKEGKGYVKKYNKNNILLAESDFKNGVINGKGKEYYNNGTLGFEGELLNGYKTGKCKLYSENGNLAFEGEFLYDQPIKGKRYINKKLEYEGEFLNFVKYNGKGYDEKGNIAYELKNGFGKVKEYFKDNEKLYFVGEYKDGKRNGKGKEYQENGKINI